MIIRKIITILLLIIATGAGAQNIWRAPSQFMAWTDFASTFSIHNGTDSLTTRNGVYGYTGIGLSARGSSGDTSYIGCLNYDGHNIPVMFARNGVNFGYATFADTGFIIGNAQAALSGAYFGHDDTIGYKVNGYTFRLPKTDTTAGYLLGTNGSGQYGFYAPPAGGIAVRDSAWMLAGNTLSDSTAQFIGSTNDFPLIHKTNNIERYRMSSNGIHTWTLPANTGAQFLSSGGAASNTAKINVDNGTFSGTTTTNLIRATSLTANTGIWCNGIVGSLRTGATDAFTARGIYGYVDAARTATNLFTDPGGGTAGNIGAMGQVSSNASGYNAGVVGLAVNSTTRNIGVFGVGTGELGGSWGIGVIGQSAFSAGSGEIGGYFGLDEGAAPALISAALVANNGIKSNAIFRALDAGSTVVQIADGGNAFFGGTTTPTAKIHVGASTATASTGQLKFTAGTPVTTPEAGDLSANTNAELLFSTSTTTDSRGFLQHNRYTAKTANYTATANDYFIDFTANTDTLTLPTAVGIRSRTYCINNSGGGTVVLATTSAQTIDGNATLTLSLATNKNYLVISDNANWKIVSAK